MLKWLRDYSDGYSDGRALSQHLGIREKKSRFASMVLSQGNWFMERICASDFEVARVWRASKKPRAGKCFLNAKRFSLYCESAKYVEGFYFLEGVPWAHAWNVIGDTVIDFTFEAVTRKCQREGKEPSNFEPLYRGVEVSKELLTNSKLPVLIPADERHLF
jgi:hypothetical protein